MTSIEGRLGDLNDLVAGLPRAGYQTKHFTNEVKGCSPEVLELFNDIHPECCNQYRPLRSLQLTYRATDVKRKEEVIRVIEAIKTCLKELDRTQMPEKTEKRIRKAVDVFLKKHPGQLTVELSKQNPISWASAIQMIKEHQELVEELKEYGHLPKEATFEELKQFFIVQWPFLRSYCNSDLDAEEAVVELAYRQEALKAINQIRGIDPKCTAYMKMLLKSFPDPIQKNPTLRRLLGQYPETIQASLKTSQRLSQIKRLGLSLKGIGWNMEDELIKHAQLHENFQALLNCGGVMTPRVDKEVTTRNAVYIQGDGDDHKVVIKTMDNDEALTNEVAGSEMLELLGFKEVLLPTTRACLAANKLDDDTGTLEMKALEQTDKQEIRNPKKRKKHWWKKAKPTAVEPRTVLIQQYLSGRSVLDVVRRNVKAISVKIQAEDETQGFGLFSLLRPKRDFAVADVSAIENVDLRSFQLCTLMSFIIGHRDANFGNWLFDKDGRTLKGIDHEEIMPDNNISINFRRECQISCDIKIKDGQLGQENAKKGTLLFEGGAPIHNALIGWPAATKPFLPEVIEHILLHVSVEKIRHYHQSRKVFSEDQVNAQIERIQLLLNMFKAQKKKSPPTLTPRKLYFQLVGNHPTYKLLVEDYNLSPYFVWQLMGRTTSGANKSEAKNLYNRMVSHMQASLTKQIKNLRSAHGRLNYKIPKKLMEEPHFSDAVSYQEIATSIDSQPKLERDTNMYRMIWGKEKPKTETPPFSHRRPFGGGLFSFF